MGIPILALLGYGMALSGMFFGLPPLSRAINYWSNRLWSNALPTLSECIEAYYRGLIDYETLKEWVKSQGYDEDKLKLFLEMFKRLYTLEMLITMKFRGVINDEEFYTEMQKLGYDKDRADRILKISWHYPSVSDWIRFAVRDVFVKDIVEKYGYDEEFPGDKTLKKEELPTWLQSYVEGDEITINELVEKAGLDKQTLKWYWRAHWELPSPTAGYEMLHRLHPDVLDMKLPDGSKYGEKYKEMGLNPEEIKTDLKTLRELLKIADIPKYWRDRLIAIAYSPLTRVDLRRIYEMGLISDEEVLARLMEYGYTRKDAELLLKWFKAMKIPTERDLTKSEILKLYHYRFIDKEKAKELLKGLGYDEDETEFLLLLEDYKLYNEIIDEKLKTLRLLYARGVIDDQKLYDELNKLNLPSYKIEHEMERAQREKMKVQRIPSKSDLEKMLMRGIITEDEFRKNMKRLGYDDYWINKYLQMLKGGA